MRKTTTQKSRAQQEREIRTALNKCQAIVKPLDERQRARVALLLGLTVGGNYINASITVQPWS